MAYIGQSIKNGTFTVLDTSGNTYNGSNTTFSLGTQVGSAAQLLVSHDGVIQKPGTDYTLATGGTQITFTTAPASGASIFIVEISGAVGGTITPSDNSVGIDQLNLSDGSSGQFLKTDGSGTISFATVTSTTINNNADNRLITGSGTANTLEGEANLTFDGTNLDMGDSKRIRLGASQDLQIFHDGSNSFIADTGTGNFVIRGTELRLNNSDNSLNYITCTDGGATALFHNGASKLATTSTGVEVTGGVRSPSGSDLTIGRTSGALMTAGGDAFVPTSSNSFDLGSTSAVWRNIYTSDFHMTNEGLDKGNDIDGTKGSWTFQEGEENLYLINNKNGKKYKFNLTEIE